jgi:hypothetical protein
MIRHDSLRLRARAFMNVRVGLLAMVVAMTFAVAMVAPAHQRRFNSSPIP